MAREKMNVIFYGADGAEMERRAAYYDAERGARFMEMRDAEAVASGAYCWRAFSWKLDAEARTAEADAERLEKEEAGARLTFEKAEAARNASADDTTAADYFRHAGGLYCRVHKEAEAARERATEARERAARPVVVSDNAIFGTAGKKAEALEKRADALEAYAAERLEEAETPAAREAAELDASGARVARMEAEAARTEAERLDAKTEATDAGKAAARVSIMDAPRMDASGGDMDYIIVLFDADGNAVAEKTVAARFSYGADNMPHCDIFTIAEAWRKERGAAGVRFFPVENVALALQCALASSKKAALRGGNAAEIVATDGAAEATETAADAWRRIVSTDAARDIKRGRTDAEKAADAAARRGKGARNYYAQNIIYKALCFLHGVQLHNAASRSAEARAAALETWTKNADAWRRVEAERLARAEAARKRRGAERAADAAETLTDAKAAERKEREAARLEAAADALEAYADKLAETLDGVTRAEAKEAEKARGVAFLPAWRFTDWIYGADGGAAETLEAAALAEMKKNATEADALALDLLAAAAERRAENAAANMRLSPFSTLPADAEEYLAIAVKAAEAGAEAERLEAEAERLEAEAERLEAEAERLAALPYAREAEKLEAAARAAGTREKLAETLEAAREATAAARGRKINGRERVETAAAIYGALRRFTGREKTRRERDISTEYITDGGGNVISWTDAARDIIHGGGAYVAAAGVTMDAETAAEIGDALAGFYATFTAPVEKRVFELLAETRGNEKRVAEIMRRSSDCIARHVDNIRIAGGAFFRERFAELSTYTDGAAEAAAERLAAREADAAERDAARKTRNAAREAAAALLKTAKTDADAAAAALAAWFTSSKNAENVEADAARAAFLSKKAAERVEALEKLAADAEAARERARRGAAAAAERVAGFTEGTAEMRLLSAIFGTLDAEEAKEEARRAAAAYKRRAEKAADALEALEEARAALYAARWTADAAARRLAENRQVIEALAETRGNAEKTRRALEKLEARTAEARKHEREALAEAAAAAWTAGSAAAALDAEADADALEALAERATAEADALADKNATEARRAAAGVFETAAESLALARAWLARERDALEMEAAARTAEAREALETLEAKKERRRKLDAERARKYRERRRVEALAAEAREALEAEAKKERDALEAERRRAESLALAKLTERTEAAAREKTARRAVAAKKEAARTAAALENAKTRAAEAGAEAERLEKLAADAAARKMRNAARLAADAEAAADTRNAWRWRIADARKNAERAAAAALAAEEKARDAWRSVAERLALELWTAARG